MKTKKIISLFEITIILVATLSFSYFVGYTDGSPKIESNSFLKKIIKFIFSPMIKTVSASPYIPSGCCLQTKTGAICQEMPLSDSNLCIDGLVGTSCETVESCQKGCCYNSDLGVCSMNSPKEKCESTGGEWNSDESCNIEECQSGCCIIGTGASLSTNRECTLTSRLFDVEKIFLPLDSAGSCSAYIGLSQEGACIGASTDFSKERSCTYTTKGNCNGEFKQGYLCTSEELNTSCKKTKNTMCVDGKDQIYFMDSCGNKANIYDSSKYNDNSYWEKYISPAESCQGQDANCGNCKYTTGSVCTKYVSGKDLTKPIMGDYVCKNLNCANGRKHGESWCVYDFDPNSGIAPVGSRHYLATCLEGEISISGCADFNQEICAQSTDTSYGFTEARCIVNDWRSCINSNDADSYSEVKKKCDENPQCVMFDEIYSNLNRSDGEILASFDPEKTNSEQGTYGEIGEDQNKILAHCVPKFTPGFQFWTAGSNIITGSDSKSSASPSSASYGGGEEETSAICSLGNFVCVSQKHRSCTLAGGCDNWNDGDLNWECNSDGAHIEIKGEDLPNLLAALNERCRALGTCGVSSNYLGSTNEERPGFSVSRIKITKKGDTKENIDVSSYNLSSEYISSIKKATPKAEKLTDITSTNGGLSAEDADSAGTSGEVSGGVVNVKDIIGSIDFGDSTSSFSEFVNFAGPITGTALMIPGVTSWLTSTVFISKTIVSGWGNVIATYTKYALGKLPTGTTLSTSNMFSTSPKTTITTTTPRPDSLVGAQATVITVAATIIGSYIGSQIGSLIAKNKGWSPGKAAQFTQLMGAIGGAVGSYAAVAYLADSLWKLGVFGWAAVIIAALMIIYEAWFNSFQEQEYYIMQFECSSWKAPANGDCNVCNEDVRPCSEYRCKSIGSNCHYFTENGEPGYCASLSEIWSAKITPWNNVLTEGNKYASIKDSGFKVEGTNKEEVAAWKPLTFGIVTDKQAICKLDMNHSADFDQMQYTMLSSMDYSTGKLDGMHHSITLSPHMNGITGGEGTTPELKEGENEYYIKCRNFAGQTNDAAFVVQVKQSEGPDLTETQILRFEPASESYLAMGTNTTAIKMYLNEPAECKYSIEYDEIRYDDMNNSFVCMTSPSFAYYGEWPCYASLENITSKKIDLFVKCKDQPELEETDLITRIVNSQSDKYTLNICETGLEIPYIYPNNGEVIEINSSSNLNLQVQTAGCINAGDAICTFSVDGYGNLSSLFLETGTRMHQQPITTLGVGDKQVNINCQDSAGNEANTSVNFTIYLDDKIPQITRVSKTKSSLILQTDEEAECFYAFNNKTIGCSFEVNATGKYKTIHNINLEDKQNGLFYIKCADKKGNYPIGCTGVISTI